MTSHKRKSGNIEAKTLLPYLARVVNMPYEVVGDKARWDWLNNGNKRVRRIADRQAPFIHVVLVGNRLHYKWNTNYTKREADSSWVMVSVAGRMWRKLWKAGVPRKEFISKWRLKYPQYDNSRALEIIREAANMWYETEVRKEDTREQRGLPSQWPALQPPRTTR